MFIINKVPIVYKSICDNFRKTNSTFNGNLNFLFLNNIKSLLFFTVKEYI